MQALSRTRQLTRLLKHPVLSNSPQQWAQNTLSSAPLWNIQGNYLGVSYAASFSTEANTAEISPTEEVKVLYDKINESVNTKRTMSPNAWLWSMISNCKNREDIKLLFDTLLSLRRFRLSNLRIHDDFNCHLCREVAKACACAGAVDFGKKTLWRHNIYGLAPTVGSANHLLSYAKDHNDVKLMDDVMKLLKKNNIPLQPGTADTVVSICYNSNDWELISKYTKIFIKEGIKLRKTSFDKWMDFAAKRGDTESLWKIEKLRSDSVDQHTLVSGFSCAKGLLLERKPEEAAAVIQLLNQSFPDKKSGIAAELQKLVSEWPLDVVKHQAEEDSKVVAAAALKSNIAAMVTSLSNIGVEANVNLDDLAKKEEITS